MHDMPCDAHANRANRAAEIYGNWGTLLLPIDSEDNIDWNILEREIDTLTYSHLNGIYSNGTAGEFYAQTKDEYECIQTMLAQGCKTRNIPFQIGASYPAVEEMLERIEFAKTLEPTAIQIILPDWFPLSLQEILRFLKKIHTVAEQQRIVLYNPPHAKTSLSPEDIFILMNEIPSLVGMKLAGGEDEWYRKMQPCFKELSVFIPGHHLVTGILHGAHGAYSNVSCISPVCAQRWYELITTDFEKALLIEKEIRYFMDTQIVPFITSGYSNHACDKAMAYMGGWCKELHPRLRFPYQGIDENELQKCKASMYSMLKNFLALPEECYQSHL